MKDIKKIIKYSFSDISRSHWNYFYFSFYFLVTGTLLFLNHDLSKAIITLINIIIVLTPLIGILFGIMYFYHSQEFSHLLLALPIRRRSVFLGQYLGLSLSLSLSFFLGLGVPFLFYGLFWSAAIWDFLFLIISGIALSFVFTGIAFWIALSNDNRIQGFALAILAWLFLAVIYDGIFLLLLSAFHDYPLDKAALLGSLLNPIDLSRILILLKLDISALLGYTGAVFQAFFGNLLGLLVSLVLLVLWVIAPILGMLWKIEKKDF